MDAHTCQLALLGTTLNRRTTTLSKRYRNGLDDKIVDFFQKHVVKNAPQKGTKKQLAQLIAERELLDLREALFHQTDRRDAAVIASTMCLTQNQYNRNIEASNLQAHRYARSTGKAAVRQDVAEAWNGPTRVLQIAMAPKQFASWIGSQDLLRSLIGPCRELWARYDLLIRGFARIHCHADSSASRDVMNIIQRSFAEYPDAATAKCSSAIFMFLAIQDELKLEHVERLWNVVVAPTQRNERSDTELS